MIVKCPLLAFFIFIIGTWAEDKKCFRQMSAVDDETYATLFALTSGEFVVPVKDRSRSQKAACVRFWRAKSQFSISEVNGRKRLFFKGKEVTKKSELSALVEKEFRHCKGAGSRKLNRRLIKRFQGVSERNVQNVLSKSRLSQKMNARFQNKAIQRPIRAKTVQVRHQIDLVDMKKSAVSKNGKTYKYILTVQDVFSRYLWLRPLTGKSSKLVARELNKLYTEVGPPRVIQSDNGGEFKQAVDLLCKSLGVKIIRGSPYHPQSQGKVERSHRSLRKKINFDLINFSKVGVNWVSKLMEYQKVLNEELMDVLGKQSPFEVFYGRASNALSEISDGGLSYQESVSSAARISPRASDFRNNGERIRKIRSKARASNNVWDKRYIKRRVKGNPPSVYKVGERVLIRFPFSGRTRGIPKKRFVVDGTIIKRNVQFGKYKITYESPTTEKSCCDWVSVEDMTSATAVEEKRKRAAARRQMSLSKTQKEHKAKKAAHREKYYIAMTPEDLHQPFSEQGFDVTYNPPGDGNCQFSALAHLLQTIGIFHSEESLRREIVRYLTENPNNQDGFPFELFVGMPWSQYLTSIAQNGTYGDQITLQAVANLFNVEIVIISTLGPNAKTVISPPFSIPFASLTLGHFAEDQGIHYVCLTALNHNYGNSSVGDEDICDKPTNEESQWAAHEIGSGENNEEPRSIEDLPNEVLEIIITFSLTGSPRNIVDTFNILSMINKRFRSLTGSFIQRLPRVFFDRDTCVGYHSMRQISKTRGKGSGLVLALKNIINHPQWINAWVRLLYTGIVGWFYIQNIIWKNGRKK